MADKTASKQRGGRPFAKGQSGNPKGRPRGSRSRSAVFGEAILQRDADAIVQAVVDAAKGGDPTAMRLCLDRLMPVRRGRPVALPLPAIATAADVDAALSVVIAAMAAGDLSAEEAGSVASVVEMKRKAIETGEHAERIALIEARLNGEGEQHGQGNGTAASRAGGQGSASPAFPQ